MAKRFKLRISKVIATTFQSCRSKDPSTLPENPVPSFFRFTPLNPTPHDDDHRRRSSFRRNVSSAFISFDCGYIYEENQTPRRKAIYSSPFSGGSDPNGMLALPPPPPPAEPKKRRGKKKKKRIPTRLRTSTSSAESGLFCSTEAGDERDDVAEEEEEEEETETENLVSSSRSFSTDSLSSDFNPHLETIRETPTSLTRRRYRRKAKNSKSSKPRTFSKNIYRASSVSEGDSPARLSVFKKLIPCSVDGKVKESFAIVKKSEDPYEDFRRSMMEMILEKQMFDEKDLEQLLQCFLSLNSRHYHGLIVEAFAEIWEAIFCSSTSKHLSL